MIMPGWPPGAARRLPATHGARSRGGSCAWGRRAESGVPARRRDGARATFDYVLFDTPPSFGFQTISALAAAGEVLIPVQMSGFAIRGLKEVLRTVHLVRGRLNPDLAILGIVPTFVNLRTRFSRQLLDGLCELANIRVFATVITPTVKLQETSLAGIPITAYASSSKAAAAYRELAGEIAGDEVAAGV